MSLTIAWTPWAATPRRRSSSTAPRGRSGSSRICASCCSGTRRASSRCWPGTPDLRERSTVHHTPDSVAGDAKPSVALRQGRNTSMRLAINAVKDGAAAAAVSAGNTGALMAMAKVVLKTLPGIDRPAMASVMPAQQRPVVILDLGANIECGAEHLFQFAVMGEVYARVMLGVAKPRVGLLNVGTEELKGDDVVRGAAAMLRESLLPIDFHGFVEGTDVTEGVVDVVVTDGFTGNVALKIAEGTAAMFTAALREAIRGGGWRAKLGYLLAKPAFAILREQVRSTALQRRDVSGPERRRGEEPWRHRCPGLRRGDRRRGRPGPQGHQRKDHRGDGRHPSRPAGTRPRDGILTSCCDPWCAASGAYLPARVMSNEELSRPGRHHRRVDPRADRHRPAPPRGRRRAHLRSRRRRRRARRWRGPGVEPADVDLILVATSTPDHTFPATATAVQRKLGIGPAIAFDLQAVCAGFAYALATADNFIRAGQARTALVIGAETFSRILDWEDRGTCVLFGDGAGAVVLRAEQQAGSTSGSRRPGDPSRRRRRPLPGPLCRWRPVLDADHRAPADERPRGVPLRRRRACRAPR